MIDKGTLVLRDGVIEAVGADVEPPADARRWDVSGKTLYAGFIDAYSELAINRHRRAPGGTGTRASRRRRGPISTWSSTRT